MADLDYKELQRVLEYIKKTEGTPLSPAGIATELSLRNAERHLAHLKDVDRLLAEFGGSNGEFFYSITSDGKDFLRKGGYNSWLNRRRRGLKRWWGSPKRIKGTTLMITGVIGTICAVVTPLVLRNDAPDVACSVYITYEAPSSYPRPERSSVAFKWSTGETMPEPISPIPVELGSFPTDSLGKAVVEVSVDAQHWKPEREHLTLKSPMHLKLIPDGRLDTLQGRVIDHLDRPVIGASVFAEDLGRLERTDSTGRFVFRIPLEKQRNGSYPIKVVEGNDTLLLQLSPTDRDRLIRWGTTWNER